MTTTKNLWQKKVARKLSARTRLETQISELEKTQRDDRKLALKKIDLAYLNKNLALMGR